MHVFEDIYYLPWRLEGPLKRRLILSLNWAEARASAVFGPAGKSAKHDVVTARPIMPATCLVFDILETPLFDEPGVQGVFSNVSHAEEDRSVLVEWTRPKKRKPRQIAADLAALRDKYYGLAIGHAGRYDRNYHLLPLDARNDRQARDWRGPSRPAWFVLERVGAVDAPWVDHDDPFTKKLPMKETYTGALKGRLMGVCAHGPGQVGMNYSVLAPEYWDERSRLPVWERAGVIDNPGGGSLPAGVTRHHAMSHADQQENPVVALPGDEGVEFHQYGGWRSATQAKQAAKAWPGKWLLARKLDT